MAKKKVPQAISVLVQLPIGSSAQNVERLSKALNGLTIDFIRAIGTPGKSMKVRSVAGPAKPIALVDAKGDPIKVPGVLLKQVKKPKG